jgi:S-formylglutathione hydrolase
MTFSVFVPETNILRAVIWLSGLTCTPDNFMQKAHAFQAAYEAKCMIVCPDTSPRDLDYDDEAYDLGSGASFYVDANKEPYKKNFQMNSYINHEIYTIISHEFHLQRIHLMGHSMGGHGALIMGLAHPDKYASINVFAPVCNPVRVPWGQKAFKAYLCNLDKVWSENDACELIMSGKKHPARITIDQGLADEYYDNQLLVGRFEELCTEYGQKLTVSYHTDYDHSYYFISSFIAKRIKDLVKY